MDHFQNNCTTICKVSSIINEKDFFGEVHFVDDENKINLKHLSIH